MHPHRKIEERSIRLHGAVADKLRLDPSILLKARRRVEGWLADGSVHPHYAEAWREILTLGPEQLAKRLIDPAEKMRALRQCSPFAGALTPQERWEILRQAKAAETA